MRWWIGGLAALCLAGGAQAQAQTGETETLAPEEVTTAYCRGVESARILAFEQLVTNACGPNKMQQPCASAKAMSERNTPEAARRRDFLESTLRTPGCFLGGIERSAGGRPGARLLAPGRVRPADLSRLRDNGPSRHSGNEERRGLRAPQELPRGLRYRALDPLRPASTGVMAVRPPSTTLADRIEERIGLEAAIAPEVALLARPGPLREPVLTRGKGERQRSRVATLERAAVARRPSVWGVGISNLGSWKGLKVEG